MDTSSSTEPIMLVTSDWHMMHHAWKNKPELYGDAECVLGQVVKAASDRNLPILAAGDLFNSKYPSISHLERTSEILCGVNGYYIMGNHDRTEIPWMKLVARNWVNLAAQPVEITACSDRSSHKAQPDMTLELAPLFPCGRNWHLYGIHYEKYADRLQEKLDELENSLDPEDGVGRILVLHQGSEPIVPVGNFELTDRMIPDLFDLVIVGHYHTPEVFRLLTKEGRSIPCLSPGGLHLKSIKEEPHKKLYTLFSDGSIRSEELVTRRVIQANFHGCDELMVRQKAEKILASVHGGMTRPELVRTPILIAEFDSHTTDSAAESLQDILEGQVHLFVRLQDMPSDGIDVSLLDDIDLEEYAESGYAYAKEHFFHCESDPEVRRLVEWMLDQDVSQEIYTGLKNDFLKRYATPELAIAT